MIEGIINELIKWEMDDTSRKSCVMLIYFGIAPITREQITESLSDVYDLDFTQSTPHGLTEVKFTKKEEIFQ